MGCDDCRGSERGCEDCNPSYLKRKEVVDNVIN